VARSNISDKESQFVVELMKELNKMLGIKMRSSTAFHQKMLGNMWKDVIYVKE